MSIFHALDISASGLTAQRLRLDIIANNIANANTTRTPEGGPFRRQLAVFAAREGTRPEGQIAPGAGFAGFLRFQGGTGLGGVRVERIVEDPREPRLVYNPGHPDADERGYVAMPNVDVVTEMVDMISATRAYEANLTAINDAKQMMLKALEIGR